MKGESETNEQLMSELEELRESEARWRSILENAPDIIFTVDREGKILFINHPPAGLSAEDALGTNALDYVPPEHRETVMRTIREVFQTGEPAQFEIAARGPNDSISEYSTLLGPVKNNGEMVAVSLITRDITERKAMEYVLRDSEMIYRSFVKNFHGIAFRGDLRYRPMFFHGDVERITGYSEKEFAEGAPTWDQIIHPGFRSAVAGEDHEKLLSVPDCSIEREYRIIRKDGQTRWVHEHIQNVCDKSGRPEFVQGTIHDITEQKTAENKIREHGRFLQSIVDALDHPLYIIDAHDYTVRLANAASDFGRLSETSTCYALTHGARQPCCGENHTCPVEQVKKTKKHVVVEHIHEDRTGNTRIYEVHAHPMFDGKGNVNLVIEFNMDITERKRIEAESQHLQKMEAIGTLAGGMAHDMNNVMAVIMGLASLLELEMAPDDPKLEDIKAMLEACRRGRNLTQDLLGFARKGKYRRERISLNQEVIDICGLLSRTIPKTIVIDTQLCETLSDARGDPDQISHAVMNICINAVDAMSGHGTLTLATENSVVCESEAVARLELKPGKHVCLRVTDTGRGMDPDILARCFEPFFTTKPKGTGTGLGLSMVYGTIANHGGVVTVKSEPGHGTTVTICIPAFEEADLAPDRDEKVTASLATGTGTILLVDDEASIQSMGQRLLESLGFTVLLAGDGKEALEVYRERRDEITLVVLDLIMPVMDGAETFRRLVEMNPEVKVLLSSGYSRQEKADEIMSLGSKGFTQKPFELHELSQAVAKALRY